MTTPLWCLAFTVFLPYVWSAVGGYLVFRSEEGLDNKYHRVQQATLTGLPARVFGAHYNALEATPAFAAAVLTAHVAGADAATAANLSLAFCAARVAHGVLYLADLDWLRSLAFLAGIGCVGGLFAAAARLV